MRTFTTVMTLLCLLLLPPLSAAECSWPAWEQYKHAMLSADGRVIDHSSSNSITTSEGQSYGLFFALVANDRQAFSEILSWTENNLVAGSFQRRLPAWLWGKNETGGWGVLDDNNATDADLWMAYSLLEAGRLWQQPEYERLGEAILWRSAAQSVRVLPQLGLMLLPADYGFESPQGWRLNPSYLVPQHFQRFAQLSPIWQDLLDNTFTLWQASAPKGFAPDWLLWQPSNGIAADEALSLGSYDAIRVYLWLGMLAEETEQRAPLLAHFAPMLAHIQTHGAAPERVDTLTGTPAGESSLGFLAALLPLLNSDAAYREQLADHRQRLLETPLSPEQYYSQSLYLFGSGWDEQRYRFDRHGRLQPAWSTACNLAPVSE